MPTPAGLRAMLLTSIFGIGLVSAAEALGAKAPPPKSAEAATPASSQQASASGAAPTSAAASMTGASGTGPASLPAFSLPDLSGKPHSPSEWKGKVVVVDFWATWCVNCRHAITALESLQQKNAGKPLQIVGIDLDQGPLDKVVKFSRKMKMDYLLLRDTTDAQSRLFGFEGIPSLYLYGKDGKLVKGLPNYAALEDKDLESLVDAALAGGPASTAKP